VAVAGRRVQLDLNSAEFQDVFFRLELVELKQVVASLRRLRELDWDTVYQHTGFRWGSDQASRGAEPRQGSLRA